MTEKSFHSSYTQQYSKYSHFNYLNRSFKFPMHLSITFLSLQWSLLNRASGVPSSVCRKGVIIHGCCAYPVSPIIQDGVKIESVTGDWGAVLPRKQDQNKPRRWQRRLLYKVNILRRSALPEKMKESDVEPGNLATTFIMYILLSQV